MYLSAVGYPIIDYDYRLFAFVRSVVEKVLKTTCKRPIFHLFSWPSTHVWRKLILTCCTGRSRWITTAATNLDSTSFDRTRKCEKYLRWGRQICNATLNLVHIPNTRIYMHEKAQDRWTSGQGSRFYFETVLKQSWKSDHATRRQPTPEEHEAAVSWIMQSAHHIWFRPNPRTTLANFILDVKRVASLTREAHFPARYLVPYCQNFENASNVYSMPLLSNFHS